MAALVLLPPRGVPNRHGRMGGRLTDTFKHPVTLKESTPDLVVILAIDPCCDARQGQQLLAVHVAGHDNAEGWVLEHRLDDGLVGGGAVGRMEISLGNHTVSSAGGGSGLTLDLRLVLLLHASVAWRCPCSMSEWCAVLTRCW